MADIKKIFSNQKVFEAFVTSVLRQKAAEQGNVINFDAPLEEETKNDSSAIKYYDAIAPEGFGDLIGPIIFEFKYSTQAEILPLDLAQLEKNFRCINKNHKASQDRIPNATFILISSRYYTNTDINRLWNVHGFPAYVWDGYVVESWCKEYPVNYSNAIGIEKLTSKFFDADINDSDFLEKSNSNIKILKDIITTDPKFALVLGAGISVGPGALLWDDLLAEMQQDLTTKKIIDNSSQVCKKVGDSSLITAQLCRDLYKEEISFCWAIHKGLYKNRKPTNASFSIYEIARLINNCKNKRHFRVLTYNFDDYLEEYLREQAVDHNILYTETSPIDDRVSIYHVHGFLPCVKTQKEMHARYMKSIFLTEENYNDLYNHPYSWQISSQLSFFRENICLFVGCSLADPNLRRLLEMTKTEGKTHFAIMRNDLATIKDLTVATSHFARLGVEVIWVNSFDEITAVLHSLQ